MEELRDCISFIDSREEAVRVSAPERLAAFSATFLDALALMSDEERVRSDCALIEPYLQRRHFSVGLKHACLPSLVAANR